MRILLGYRFTGEDPAELEKEIGALGNAINDAGHSHICSFDLDELFLKKGFTPGQIQQYMMTELRKQDALFCYIKSDKRSEGLLMEAGQAVANNQPVIVAVKKGVYTLLAQPEIAAKVIEFENLDELCEKIKNGALRIS